MLKSTWKKEKLQKQVKDNPAWALKVVIRSYDNAADMKKIKADPKPLPARPGLFRHSG